MSFNFVKNPRKILQSRLQKSCKKKKKKLSWEVLESLELLIVFFGGDYERVIFKYEFIKEVIVVVIYILNALSCM